VLQAGKKVTGATKTFTKVVTGIKAYTGFAEISAGSVNFLLKLTGVSETPLGKEISKYLFYFEMAALCGEVSVALYGKMQKSARKIVAKEEAIRATAKKEGIEAKQVDEVIEELRRVADDAYIPNKLIKQEIRIYKGVKYEISIYTKKIEWKFLDLANSKINRMELDDYSFVSFDFRIPDELLGKGFGKYFVDETFIAFKNQIKGATASWTEFSAYPGGSSLGYKQFWKAYKELGDEIKALETTDFYQLMSNKYGISKIKKGDSVDIGEFDQVYIIIYK
jgi:hypothetical protein